MISLAEQSRESEDTAAVAAVLRGEVERYRELVERYQRRVFAIAWSHLGDQAMAEDASQEAFIRAYRRLSLLADGAKFGPWIGAIARNTARTLALRNRRELKRHERWALENLRSDTREEAPEHATDALQCALAELPANSRECLIAFYVEKRSGADAARVLGISEPAFRVRLHRARAALREKLEETLAVSLEDLRPAVTLVSAVMTAVAATSTTKAATAGAAATAAGTAAKITPLTWLSSWMLGLAVLPFAVFTWIYTRMESRNFHDDSGFRARLFRETIARRALWVFPIMVAIFAFNRFWIAALEPADFATIYLVLGFVVLVLTLPLVRLLRLIQNRYFRGFLCAQLLSAAAMLVIGFGGLPVSNFFLVLCPQMAVMAWIFGERPVRMDYNLFLRASERMLPRNESAGLNERRTNHVRTELMEFAAFLGSRWLVTNYRWRRDGLYLTLPSVKGGRCGLSEYLGTRLNASSLFLGHDGSVRASLSPRDLRALNQMGPPVPEGGYLERIIAEAVSAAWNSFRRGDRAAALVEIGETSEECVFRVAPRKTAFTRWYRRMTAAIIVLTLALGMLLHFRPPWMEGLRPVTCNEQDVRTALAEFQPESAGTNRLGRGLVGMLAFGLVLPGTNLMTPETINAIRQEVLNFSKYQPVGELKERCARVAIAWPMAKVIEAGWIQPEDLGVSRTALAGYFRNPGPYGWTFRLSRQQGHLDHSEFVTELVNSMNLSQLRWLRDLGCLDVVDRGTLVKQIAGLQVLSGEPISSRPPLRDWKKLRGLFVTLGSPVLQDTYCQLAALEILGGLDHIDREACIERILKLHRGGGYFVGPQIHQDWRLHISGGARDAFCAFESLRILGALNRVSDLVDWKFRLKARERGTPLALTWNEIEAWCFEQRLQETLASAKTDARVENR